MRRAAQLVGLRLGLALAGLAGLAAVGALSACKRSSPQGRAVDAGEAGAAATELTSAPSDATGDGGGATAAPGEAPHLVYALASPTPIFSAPEWPPHDPTKATEERAGVVRLGYLRKGQAIAYRGDVVAKQNCAEGWYELATGGFVCGKFATTDAGDKELQKAPHAPFADGPLPYQYGLNLTNGAPLYRRPPLRRERAEYERGIPGGRAPGDGNGGGSAPGDGNGGESPWYLKEHHGARPAVTLDELKGETSLIDQRMVRGFYLALDQEVRAFSGKFWRTTRGMFVPVEHIIVHQPKTEFEGVWFGAPGETRKLPLGWVLGLHARKYTVNVEEKKVKRGADKVGRFTIVQLTGKKAIVDQRTYFETDEGWWMRDVDGTVTDPAPAPKDLDVAHGEKWIDVNLKTQSVVAFEGDKPVFATIVSSGRHDDDPSKDHRTVTGAFRIREKHVSITMEDNGAGDGVYSIEDVPWTMYFQAGYALHGAFWHSAFGHERSHGCVNMTPHDARMLFGWVEPRLPDGWHGVRATDDHPGTRVVVHE